MRGILGERRRQLRDDHPDAHRGLLHLRLEPYHGVAGLHPLVDCGPHFVQSEGDKHRKV